jgi:hypothetical protein
LSGVTMKFTKFLLISFTHFALGFLPYPFLADNLLGSFLKTLDISDYGIDLTNFIPGEQCSRECTPNDRQICHFSFMMKSFQIMGG